MAVAETTVTDRGGSTVPAELRDRLDIEPGDKLRWLIEDDGTVVVEVKRQRDGTLRDFGPFDSGSPIDSTEADDVVGAQEWERGEHSDGPVEDHDGSP